MRRDCAADAETPPRSEVPPLSQSLFRPLFPEIDHRTVGEILQHPGFASMRRGYVAGTTACQAIDAFPGGLQGAVCRTNAVGVLVCLWAAYDPADRATWPTLARFKRAIATFGLSSPRQIDDLVRRLTGTGHVVLEQAAADRRLRLLRPTERLLAWDREAMASYYDALQILYPDPGYGPAVARDPALHLAQRRSALAMFPVIAGFLQEIGDLLPVLAMYQGGVVLLVVADRTAPGTGEPIRERDLADLQDRFGVSRSHIRNILVAAKAAGLLAGAEGSPKRFALTPRGTWAVDLFIANTLATSDLSYRLALADLGQDPGAPARAPV